METYSMMRAFADSWALLAMVIFFLAVVARVLFLPGAYVAVRRWLHNKHLLRCDWIIAVK